MKEAFTRLGAYILDLLLIYFTAAIISSFILVSTGYKSYMETYDSFINTNTLYQDFFNDFESSYKDNKLEDEEYNKLISEYEEIAIGLVEAYQDLELTQKEYDKIHDDSVSEYDDKYIQGNYDLAKESTIVSVVTIVLMIIYFVFIQYFTNGQTVGKKVLNLRVTNNDNEHVTINNLLLRSLIITDIVWSAIKLYCLYTMDAYGYNNACYYLNSIMYFILFISLLCIIYRKDQRALHDLFAGTKVIRTGADQNA